MNEYYETFTDTIRWLWVQGPIYLVWIAGIFWALVTWKRHPRKSFLVMLALGTFLLEALASPFVYQFLSQRLLTASTGNVMADFQARWAVVQLCHAVVHAGLWLLLLLALFVVDRRPQPPRGPDGERLPPDWDRPADPPGPGRERV